MVDCRRFRGVGTRVGDMLGLSEGGKVGGMGWCAGDRGRVGDRALCRTWGTETGRGDVERRGGLMTDVVSSWNLPERTTDAHTTYRHDYINHMIT